MTQPALPVGQPTQQQQPSHGAASGSMGLPQQQPQPGHATVQVKLPTGAVGVRGAQAAGRTDGAEVLGYWTDEEMGFLLAAISKVTGGSMNDNGLDWGAVAALVPSRSAKQCRQKYLNHLRQVRGQRSSAQALVLVHGIVTMRAASRASMPCNGGRGCHMCIGQHQAACWQLPFARGHALLAICTVLSSVAHSSHMAQRPPAPTPCQHVPPAHAHAAH